MPYLAAGGTLFFWSSAFPAVKYALDYFSPGGLVVFRFLIASAVLIAYCAIKRTPMPTKKHLPLFVLCGLMLFIYMWAFNAGTDLVPSGISGFIIASAPVFTLILSIVFLRERASLKVWLGVLISFGGIIVIAATQMVGFSFNLGIWLLLCAAITTSTFIIIQRQLLKTYTVMQVTAYPIVIATVFMCVFLPSMITELPNASTSSIFVVAYLGIFPAALAYLLWAYALNKAQKTVHITSFLYLSPFLASVMAFLWLGEVIPPQAYIGGVIVICGMLLVNRTKRVKEKENESK